MLGDNMKIILINGDSHYLIENGGKFYSVYFNDSKIELMEVKLQSWLKFCPYAREYKDDDKVLYQKILKGFQEFLKRRAYQRFFLYKKQARFSVKPSLFQILISFIRR